MMMMSRVERTGLMTLRYEISSLSDHIMNNISKYFDTFDI